MALTPQSFQIDPRKQLRVKALTGFHMEGRKPVEPDEVVVLPRHFALEMLHANKVVKYDDAAEAAAKADTSKASGNPGKEK